MPGEDEGDEEQEMDQSDTIKSEYNDRAAAGNKALANLNKNLMDLKPYGFKFSIDET